MCKVEINISAIILIFLNETKKDEKRKPNDPLNGANVNKQ